MSFGQILSRGVTAAHRSVVGLVLLFLLYGWHQGVSVVIGGAFDPQEFVVQPGQPPPASLMTMMAFGCASCFWMLVMLFASPWVTGGVMGQLRDRIAAPEQPAGRLIEYAGTYYVRCLALTLLLVVTLAVIMVGWVLLSLVLSGVRLQPGAMQPQDIERMNTSPVNIALSVVFAFVLSAFGVVFHLATAAIITEHTDALTSLGSAWQFVVRRFADTIKLTAVVCGPWLVFWAINLVRTLLEWRGWPILAVQGVVTALAFPYLVLLNHAWGMSLWLAQREGSPESGDARGGEAEGAAAE